MTRARVFALASAALGVAVFLLAGLPLPWLLGPMFGCLVAALLGVPLQGTPVATNTMRTVLGLAVGTSITPALFAILPTMLWSLALVPVMTVVIGLVGYPYFRRLGFDHATAYYGTMPGGLQDMLAFGEEAGADIRALSLIHATRVLIVVTVLPVVLSVWLKVDLTNAPGVPARAIPVHEGALMVVLALGGWWAARAVGLFGASILGPMIAGAAASLLDLIHYRPPAEAILAAQFFIGFGVGVKYVGLTLAELRRVVASAAGYTLLIFAIAGLFAAIVLRAGLAPVTEGILSFAPGGQAEMAIFALVAGADVGFVVAHHVIRIVFVIVGAPLFARLRL